MGYPEALAPICVDDEDWRLGERVRCNCCTRHVRVAVRVATLIDGEEVYMCGRCITRASHNLIEAGLAPAAA
jgi:hypothetical protein